ncbi:MAG TPA: CBS domain-containing protein, partial [Blastocatellia bacterium]|nr:CBS domain-containing protein [Blastocatellia bacterium]
VDRGGAGLSEVISKNLELAHPDQTLNVAMIKLGRKGVSQLPVVSRNDASKLLGIITLHDIAEALSKEDEAGSAANEDKA